MKTAIMKIYNDIVNAIANGQVALLGLLDLSATLDSIDQDILLWCLQKTYGLKDTVST